MLGRIARSEGLDQTAPEEVFCFCFVLFEVYVPVNSYGHVKMVSSTNHTESVPLPYLLHQTTSNRNFGKPVPSICSSIQSP